MEKMAAPVYSREDGRVADEFIFHNSPRGKKANAACDVAEAHKTTIYAIRTQSTCLLTFNKRGIFLLLASHAAS